MLLLFICRRHPHLNGRVCTDNRATVSEKCHWKGPINILLSDDKEMRQVKSIPPAAHGNFFESDACLQSRNPRYSSSSHLCATWCRLAPVSPSSLSSGAESIATVISSLCWSCCACLINLFASTPPAFFALCRNTQYCVVVNIQTHQMDGLRDLVHSRDANFSRYR